MNEQQMTAQALRELIEGLPKPTSPDEKYLLPANSPSQFDLSGPAAQNEELSGFDESLLDIGEALRSFDKRLGDASILSPASGIANLAEEYALGIPRSYGSYSPVGDFIPAGKIATVGAKAAPVVGGALKSMILGVKAVEKLKEGPQMLKKLEVAKRMDRAGVDEDTIWQNTLWRNDPIEGKWLTETPSRSIDFPETQYRNEIQPHIDAANIKRFKNRTDPDQKFYRNAAVPLEDVLHDPAMQQLLPHLEGNKPSLEVDLVNMGYAGAWSPSLNKMRLGEKTLPPVSAHESSHIVDEISDLSKGGSSESAHDLITNALRTNDIDNDKYKFLESLTADDQYSRIVSEARANAVGARLDKPIEKIKKRGYWKDYQTYNRKPLKEEELFKNIDVPAEEVFRGYGGDYTGLELLKYSRPPSRFNTTK
jgi:hypothetical protein